MHITPANIHDSKTMPEITYESGAHYIFDRGYNDFSNLNTINRIGAFFVVRAKTLYHRFIEADGVLNSSSKG